MQTETMTFDKILQLLPFQLLPAQATQPQQPSPPPARCICGATVQPDGQLPCGH